jgi:hypothetical protein
VSHRSTSTSSSCTRRSVPSHLMHFITSAVLYRTSPAPRIDFCPEHDDWSDGGEDDPHRELSSAVSPPLRFGRFLGLSPLFLEPRGRIGRVLELR